MKTLLCAAVLAATLAAPVQAQSIASSTPPIVIHYDKHSAHAQKFTAVQGKSSYWRAEERKKGIDIAFTEWMQVDHPWEFSALCVKTAGEAKKKVEHTGHIAEFQALAAKRADLKASIAAAGFDAAFLDWLRTAHPDSYKKQVQGVAK